MLCIDGKEYKIHITAASSIVTQNVTGIIMNNFFFAKLNLKAMGC